MKILNFGSLNLDLVHQVPHFCRAGETISSTGYQMNVGGKGLNQSVAFKRAGAQVYHAGLIGRDGRVLKEFLEKYGVDTRFVRETDTPSGHAVIQVIPEGNNCIFLYGGANQCVTDAFIAEVFEAFDAGDYLVLQNEINAIDRIIETAAGKGIQVVLNPSPCDEKIAALPLEKVNWFIVNEIEGAYLSDGETEPDRILDRLLRKYPDARIVLTLGEAGSVYADASERVYQEADRVRPVDTTAAGDTFTGFFFAAVAEGESVSAALKRASRAAAISVTRPGAAASVPSLEEVISTLG